MARYLVPVVPPFVHQGVVRVRVGDEMGSPEQRECHTKTKICS